MWKWPFRKNSYRGTKIQLAKKKPLDSIYLWKFYSEGFHFKRVFIEIISPILIALFSIIISLMSNTSLSETLLKIKDMNGQIADVVAIQTGFNITCLALIASFNRDTLQKSLSKVQDDKKEAALKQLLSSFVYCVFLQTSIIILGIGYNASVEDILNIDLLKHNINHFIKGTVVYIFFAFWIAIILHSFMVFLRNVTLIYKFILVVFKK